MAGALACTDDMQCAGRGLGEPSRIRAAGSHKLRGRTSSEPLFSDEVCAADTQGFNVMADDLGGWGQVTADLLGELHDDYPTSPVLLWATRQSASAPSSDVSYPKPA